MPVFVVLRSSLHVNEGFCRPTGGSDHVSRVFTGHDSGPDGAHGAPSLKHIPSYVDREGV